MSTHTHVVLSLVGDGLVLASSPDLPRQLVWDPGSGAVYSASAARVVGYQDHQYGFEAQAADFYGALAAAEEGQEHVSQGIWQRRNHFWIVCACGKPATAGSREAVRMIHGQHLYGTRTITHAEIAQ